MDIEIDRTVREVLAKLIGHDYLGLEQLTNARNLNAKEIAQAVGDEGLVMPPEAALAKANMTQIYGRTPPTYYVGVDLWTQSGPSDLTLEMTLIEDGERFIVEIDNIHVL